MKVIIKPKYLKQENYSYESNGLLRKHFHLNTFLRFSLQSVYIFYFLGCN